MSENKIDTEIKVSDNGEKAEKTKKSKSFLVYYSIALFLFAGILIALSYLSQARVAADTDKIRQEIEAISEKTEISTGVQTRLEQVSAKNDDLEKSNEALIEENTQLKTQVESLKGADKRAEATEYIWKIEKAFASKNKKECRKLIEELNNKGLRTSLSSDALSELVRIETSIN